MEAFAVIDTETNWSDQVMSIGTIIADAETFRLIDAKYHVLTPEYLVGGMFSDTLFIDRNTQNERLTAKYGLVYYVIYFIQA